MNNKFAHRKGRPHTGSGRHTKRCLNSMSLGPAAAAVEDDVVSCLPKLVEHGGRAEPYGSNCVAK